MPVRRAASAPARCRSSSSVGLRPASHSSSSSSSRLERERAGELQPLLVDIGELAGRHAGAAARPTRSSSASAALRPRRPRAAARPKARPAMTFSRQVSDAQHAHELEGARDAEPRDAMRRRGRRSAGRAKRMLPASGRSAPEIRLSTVVLPEPFGPIRPDDLARRRPRSRRRRRRRSPPKRRGRPSTSSSALPRRHAARVAPAGAAPARQRSTSPTTPSREEVDDQDEDEAEQDAEVVGKVARAGTRTAAPAARRRAPAHRAGRAPPSSAMITHLERDHRIEGDRRVDVGPARRHDRAGHAS